MQTHWLDTKTVKKISKDCLNVFGLHDVDALRSPRISLERFPVSVESLSLYLRSIATFHGLELVEEQVETQEWISMWVLWRSQTAILGHCMPNLQIANRPIQDESAYNGSKEPRCELLDHFHQLVAKGRVSKRND